MNQSWQNLWNKSPITYLKEIKQATAPIHWNDHSSAEAVPSGQRDSEKGTVYHLLGEAFASGNTHTRVCEG